LKIVLIHRPFKPGGFSVEELFHAVADVLRPQVDLIEYEAGRRWSLLRDVWQLRKLKADIYHVTGDINYLVLLLPWRKTVLTVHDIGHFLFGLTGFKRWLYKWLWLVWPMRAARRITAVSKATEDAVVAHLGIARSRISTIDNCHSPLFKLTLRPFNQACPVILQVGTKPYKNVPRLIEALQGIPCKLVLIGVLDQALHQQLMACGIDHDNRVNLHHQQVAQAYVDCDIVSFVSVGEGFGVPIIEAQATGRPLVTSDLPPMSDVAGPGACLVSPLDVAQIRRAIQALIGDAAYRQRIVDAGLRNAARYSPQAIGGQYLALYRGLCAS
jgi:glycosyltransferase involved in cell wall biosynthesis